MRIPKLTAIGIGVTLTLLLSLAVHAAAPAPMPLPRSGDAVVVSTAGTPMPATVAAPVTRAVANGGIPAAPPARSPRVVFFGDSLSDENYPLGAGWTDRVIRSLGWQKVSLSAAHAGSTLAEHPIPATATVCCTPLMDRVAQPLPYQIAVIEIGVNDLQMGGNDLPAAYRAAWERVWAQLPVGTVVYVLDVPLLVSTAVPHAGGYLGWASGWEDGRAQLTAINRAEARAHGARIVALDGETPAMLQDPVHLNSAGMDFFAARLIAAV